MNQKIIQLRKALHQYPEVSNKEYDTSERITDFMKAFLPDEILSLSNTGKAFVFNGKETGKTTVFRAELDALPIAESSAFPHASVHQNVAHICGHDGHMAILAGLAQQIALEKPRYGRVVLLFQPAEEVGQGAQDMVEDAAFIKLHPDCIFALHNIPGAKKHLILVKSGSFAAASKGMTVKLYGKTAHAAEPENGISPANAISRIIGRLHELKENKSLFKDMALLTIIHISLGEISFGTSPGYAEIRLTLRSFENADMEQLTSNSEKIIKEISREEHLEYDIAYSEIFPAAVNDDSCLNRIIESAMQNNYPLETLEKPFKWSEDFGVYSQQYKCCLFGLGAGVSQPPLHNPDYDFPDEIIETGINMFYQIYKKINLENDR